MGSLQQSPRAAAKVSWLAALLLFTACDADHALTGVATPGAAAFAVVPSSFAVTPSAVVLRAGETMRFTALGSDGSTVRATWSSSNPDVAWVGAWGKVHARRGGTATITATTAEGSATAVVTVHGAPPVAYGIWISKAELDALPMSGPAWSGPGELKNTADTTWTVQALEVQHRQKYNVQAMAGALVFARLYPDTTAEAYRTKVVQAIRTVMSRPDNRLVTATPANRFLGTWAITADLINLPAHDPVLDRKFRVWLKHKLDLPYLSRKTVRYQLAHANNQGSWATFSIAAVSAYLGDRASLATIALRYRRWLGDTSVPFQLKWTDDQSFQLNPLNSATWVGINPRGARRNGHNFDGLQPSDQNRGLPMVYDSTDFPNNFSTVRYGETSLHGVLGAVLILHRAGYTDLLDASDQAILRAARWIKFAADNFPADGYQYFTGPHEAARPLLQYFYPTSGLPADRVRPQLTGSAYGYAWTFWTHAGRTVQQTDPGSNGWRWIPGSAR